MTAILTALFLASSLIVPPAIAGILRWDDLRVKFGLPMAPSEQNFVRQPRRVFDAVQQGFSLISRDCNNNGKFFGQRYKHPGEDSIILLYDAAGVIAGIQGLFRDEELTRSNNPYRYDLVGLFQNEMIDGIKYFVITAYFMPPDLICSGYPLRPPGSKFLTGFGVWLQNGTTPDSLILLPRSRDVAAKEGWTNANCLPGMGFHNLYRVDKWEEEGCLRTVPVQILYNGNEEMQGFVFLAQANTTGIRSEFPGTRGILGTLNPAPKCFLESERLFGITTVHVYFIDKPWEFRCPAKKEAN